MTRNYPHKEEGPGGTPGPSCNNALRLACLRGHGGGNGRLLLHWRRSHDLSVQAVQRVSELEVVDLLAVFRPDGRHLGVALRAFRVEVAGERSLGARGELIGFRLILVAQI